MKAFVYGTLKKQGWNNPLLGDSKFLGKAEVPGYKLVFSGGEGSFPFAIEDDNPEAKAAGEVYEVTYDTVARMDRLEGHPRWYLRTETKTSEGEDIFLYVLPKEHLDRNPIPCNTNHNNAYEW